jgi:tetratricopeptide (TPR) repeat protein
MSDKLMHNLACCYDKIGLYGCAIRWFEHGLKLKHRWTDALYGLSVSYFKIKKYEKALEYI